MCASVLLVGTALFTPPRLAKFTLHYCQFSDYHQNSVWIRKLSSMIFYSLHPFFHFFSVFEWVQFSKSSSEECKYKHQCSLLEKLMRKTSVKTLIIMYWKKVLYCRHIKNVLRWEETKLLRVHFGLGLEEWAGFKPEEEREEHFR